MYHHFGRDLPGTSAPLHAHYGIYRTPNPASNARTKCWPICTPITSDDLWARVADEVRPRKKDRQRGWARLLRAFESGDATNGTTQAVVYCGDTYSHWMRGTDRQSGPHVTVITEVLPFLLRGDQGEKICVRAALVGWLLRAAAKSQSGPTSHSWDWRPGDRDRLGLGLDLLIGGSLPCPAAMSLIIRLGST